jgi:hypothetical protein
MSGQRLSMPAALTAEIGAKYIFLGEYFEEVRVACAFCDGVARPREACPDCQGTGLRTVKVVISWPTIKAIYKRAVEVYGRPIEEE